MKYFKLATLAVAVMMILCVLIACAPADNTSTDTSADEQETQIVTDAEGNTVIEEITNAEQSTSVEEGTRKNAEDTIDYEIVFAGDQFRYSVADAQTTDGKNLVLTKAGIYKISGTLNDGTIVVDVAKTDRVTLLLDGFTGSCSTSSVIYVKSADKVYIDLAKGSTNTVTDASTYVYANPSDTKPNACIYSSDDLTIKGGGTLTVNGNYNNGIGCKNDIDIKNGRVIVNAVKNAVKGNDSVTVMGDAEVIIKQCEDGIKTDSLDEGKGFILITEEAKVDITCNDDALQASQSVTTTAGVVITVKAGGDIINCDGTQTIAEGTIITQ